MGRRPSTASVSKAPESSASTSNKGKSASNKPSSAQGRVSTNSSGPSGFTKEQMALYKNMHAQLEAKKKAAAAAKDEGMSTILILAGHFLVHNFFSYSI